MKLHIIFIAVVVVLSGCSRDPAKISLSNRSSVMISNVYIAGEHFGTKLGTLTPGMTMSFPLSRRGEKDVWVSFDAAGQTFDSRGKQFWIESHERPIFFEASSSHSLSLTIGGDFSVTSSSGNEGN